ncbi:hypothetical protein TIFTF001_028778 [Ficus carica]|uniref:RNase H type-1 domain-containing protein n=1 Tax=Ficus carica TaxID=3494 RepID=A0AA88DQD8_FICCA|nr:hypothetical protein TIFTF001_028778 [Ficus carica]
MCSAVREIWSNTALGRLLKASRVDRLALYAFMLQHTLLGMTLLPFVCSFGPSRVIVIGEFFRGNVKLNVDVAIDDGHGFVGIGVVVRDNQELVLGAVSCRMAGFFSPHVRECMAVREGTWFALSHGFSNWVVETDAISIYKAVFSPLQRYVETNVIDDICDACSLLGSGLICYGSREGNYVDYFLAKLALSSSCSRTWLDSLPKFLGPFVKWDIMSLE